MQYKLLKFSYRLFHKIHPLLAYTIRYFVYRKSVLEPENLLLLYNSEKAYSEVVDTNKNVIETFSNAYFKIGFLGSLSNSMIFNTNFWKAIPKDNIQLYLYEFLATGYQSSSELKNFNHTIIKANYYTSKFDRVFRDTFDYMSLATQLNQDKLDFLVVSIETLGRFTYGKLFDEITVNTKIAVLNAGNMFYYHPKISIQSQIQLPPCWRIDHDNKLIHTFGKKIDYFYFVNDLFFYDKKDVTIDQQRDQNFENIIFVHGRLSKIAQNGYLEVISLLLSEDKERQFVFMGSNDLNSLSIINIFFKKKHQLSQISYLGSYSQAKDQQGNLFDPNWQICKKYLKRSAVFLNPFPKGAGSARIEAMASGLPVIDFEIDFMNCANKSKKAYILEKLIKKNGTGYSLNEYLSLSRKTFVDHHFRQQIINEQYEIVRNFCDEKNFWNKIMCSFTLNNKLDS